MIATGGLWAWPSGSLMVLSYINFVICSLRYEQVVEQSFHVSKACLELSSDKKGETTTLIIDIDNEEFILSHVSGNKPSDTLDLQFEVGEQICFRSEVLISFDPRGLVSAYVVRSFVPIFHKTKQISSENKVRYWQDCGSGLGDH